MWFKLFVQNPKKLINKKIDKIIICSYFFVEEIIKSLIKLGIQKQNSHLD